MVVVLPVPALASTAVIPSKGRAKTSRPSVMRHTARSPRAGRTRRVRGRGTRGRAVPRRGRRGRRRDRLPRAGARRRTAAERILRTAERRERALWKEGQRAVEPLPVALREHAERVYGRRDRAEGHLLGLADQPALAD